MNVLIGDLNSDINLNMFDSLDTLFKFDVFHKYIGFFVGYRHFSLHSKMGLSISLQGLISLMSKRELTVKQLEYIFKYALCKYLRNGTGKLLKELTLKDVDALYGKFEKEVVDVLCKDVKIKRFDNSIVSGCKLNKKALKKRLRKFIISKFKKTAVEE